jgi:hypothetical protein
LSETSCPHVCVRGKVAESAVGVELDSGCAVTNGAEVSGAAGGVTALEHAASVSISTATVDTRTAEDGKKGEKLVVSGIF